MENHFLQGHKSIPTVIAPRVLQKYILALNFSLFSCSRSLMILSENH